MSDFATQAEIDDVWKELGILRLPGHDMSNERVLAARIIAMRKAQNFTGGVNTVEGVYRHWKNGHLYLVLFEAVWNEAPISLKEGITIHVIPDDFYKLAARSVTFKNVVVSPCYTGSEKTLMMGERLVVYVGLYDNPHGNRPCARPVLEWVEKVDVNGYQGTVDRMHVAIPSVKRAPRYERVS